MAQDKLAPSASAPPKTTATSASGSPGPGTSASSAPASTPAPLTPAMAWLAYEPPSPRWVLPCLSGRQTGSWVWDSKAAVMLLADSSSWSINLILNWCYAEINWHSLYFNLLSFQKIIWFGESIYAIEGLHSFVRSLSLFEVMLVALTIASNLKRTANIITKVLCVI